MSLYTPDPDQPFFTSLNIPDDGDPEQAGSVNVPFEALADSLANVRKDLYSKRLIELDEVDFNGTKSFDDSAFSTLAAGDLQPIYYSAGPWLDGDQFFFRINLVLGMQPMTEGHLKLICTEDLTFTGITGASPSGLDAGGYTVVGPYPYLGSGNTGIYSVIAPQCANVTITGKYTKSQSGTFGDGVALLMAGRAVGRGAQASPAIILDQSTLAPLTDAKFTCRTEVWRVTP